MPSIARIQGLQQKLAKLTNKYSTGEIPSVIVGYKAKYAMYVHEIPPTKNLAKQMGGERTAKHLGNKQWKFLEQPARELRGEFGRIIAESLKGGESLLQALLKAGFRLQKASQQIVPIETGNLKGSAFTDTEEHLTSLLEDYDKATEAAK